MSLSVNNMMNMGIPAQLKSVAGFGRGDFGASQFNVNSRVGGQFGGLQQQVQPDLRTQYMLTVQADSLDDGQINGSIFQQQAALQQGFGQQQLGGFGQQQLIQQQGFGQQQLGGGMFAGNFQGMSVGNGFGLPQQGFQQGLIQQQPQQLIFGSGLDEQAYYQQQQTLVYGGGGQGQQDGILPIVTGLLGVMQKLLGLLTGQQMPDLLVLDSTQRETARLDIRYERNDRSDRRDNDRDHRGHKHDHDNGRRAHGHGRSNGHHGGRH